MINQQRLIDQAVKNTPEDIKKEVIEEDRFSKLQNSARNFINTVRTAIESAAETNEEIKKLNKYNILDVYSAMKANNILNQKIISAQFTFEENFNSFLGRTIGLIWRDEKTGKIYYGTEISAKTIYEKGQTKGGGRSNVTISEQDITKKLITFDEYIDSLGSVGNRIKRHQEKYKVLQTEVSRRWEWNTNPEDPSKNRWYNIKQTKETKKGKKDTYPYRRTFWWQEEDGLWGHSKKINKGHITQTYVELMMNDDNIYSQVIPSREQQSIKQYWIYMQNHNLNNIAGIVQGDVKLIGNEMIQFAVKQGAFNTAAVGPYLTVAFLILNFQLSQSDIMNILETKNLAQLGKKISEQADILAKDAVDNKIKDNIAANIRK